jgi:hypothetical protein
MSTTTKIETAVGVAERFMENNEYHHGPCLSASLKGESGSDEWEVEFAYEGLVDRSLTSDPPSILLMVNLKSEEVRTVELM